MDHPYETDLLAVARRHAVPPPPARFDPEQRGTPSSPADGTTGVVGGFAAWSIAGLPALGPTVPPAEASTVAPVVVRPTPY